MAIYRSDLAGQIKQMLTMQEVAERYGFTPDRSGFLQCPFHQGDKHGSLKVYPDSGGWHCFGCGAGGSVIDFTMKLFDISFKQAILRLNADFGLGLTKDNCPKINRSALLEARRREKKRKEAADAEYKKKAAQYRYYREAEQTAEPESDLYAEAVKALSMLEYWLDENIGR